MAKKQSFKEDLLKNKQNLKAQLIFNEKSKSFSRILKYTKIITKLHRIYAHLKWARWIDSKLTKFKPCDKILNKEKYLTSELKTFQ